MLFGLSYYPTVVIPIFLCLQEELSSRKSELQMNSENLAKADESIFSAKAQAEFAVSEKQAELEEARAAYEMRIASLESDLNAKDAEIDQRMAEVQEITEAKVAALMKCEQAQVCQISPPPVLTLMVECSGCIFSCNAAFLPSGRL